MKTFEAPMGTRFHFSSDNYGTTQIVAPDGSAIMIPSSDLVEYIGDVYRRAMIARIENADAADILFGTWNKSEQE